MRGHPGDTDGRVPCGARAAPYTDPAQQPQAARARLRRAELEEISTNASSYRGQAVLLAGARERRAQTEVPRLHVLSAELTGDETTMGRFAIPAPVSWPD